MFSEEASKVARSNVAPRKLLMIFCFLCSRI